MPRPVTAMEILRRQQGLSQNHLAVKSDVSQATISATEAGVIVPSADVLAKLASALGTAPERLLVPVEVNA